jgi:hypothetical protein
LRFEPGICARNFLEDAAQGVSQQERDLEQDVLDAAEE